MRDWRNTCSDRAIRVRRLQHCRLHRLRLEPSPGPFPGSSHSLAAERRASPSRRPQAAMTKPVGLEPTGRMTWLAPASVPAPAIVLQVHPVLFAGLHLAWVVVLTE